MGLVHVVDVGHESVVDAGHVEVVVVLVVGSDQDGRRHLVRGGELDVLAVKVDALAIDALLGVEVPLASGDTASARVVLLVTEPKLRVGVLEREVVEVEVEVVVVVEASLTEADLDSQGFHCSDQARSEGN